MATIAELLANRREKKSRGVKRKVEELTVDEYVKRLDAQERRAELRRYKKGRELIEALDEVKFPSANEALLFTRIVDFFERRRWLPGSYRRMLRHLAEGRSYDEIIPLDNTHDLF